MVKCLKSADNSVAKLDLKVEEFRFLFKVIGAIMECCPERALHTYTGYDKEQILKFKSDLEKIASEAGVSLE